MLDLQLSPAEEASTDVSELQELVRKLSRAQREYQELVNTLDGIVWQADASFRFLFVSRQAERLLGYPIERWLKEPGFWADHRHPDDRAWASGSGTPSLAASGASGTLTQRLCAERERDRLLAAELASRAAAEESLALLDTFLNNAPVGLSFLDTDLRYIRINDSLAALHGTSREYAQGRRLHEQVPQMSPSIEPLMRRVLETGTPIIGVELAGEVPPNSGEQRHWRVSYYPVKTPSGGIVGVGAVVVEVTSERRAQAERERLLREAQEARSSSARSSRTSVRSAPGTAPNARSPRSPSSSWEIAAGSSRC